MSEALDQERDRELSVLGAPVVVGSCGFSISPDHAEEIAVRLSLVGEAARDLIAAASDREARELGGRLANDVARALRLCVEAAATGRSQAVRSNVVPEPDVVCRALRSMANPDEDPVPERIEVVAEILEYHIGCL